MNRVDRRFDGMYKIFLSICSQDHREQVRDENDGVLPQQLVPVFVSLQLHSKSKSMEVMPQVKLLPQVKAPPAAATLFTSKIAKVSDDKSESESEQMTEDNMFTSLKSDSKKSGKCTNLKNDKKESNVAKTKAKKETNGKKDSSDKNKKSKTVKDIKSNLVTNGKVKKTVVKVLKKSKPEVKKSLAKSVKKAKENLKSIKKGGNEKKNVLPTKAPLKKTKIPKAQIKEAPLKKKVQSNSKSKTVVKQNINVKKNPVKGVSKNLVNGTAKNVGKPVKNTSIANVKKRATEPAPGTKRAIKSIPKAKEMKAACKKNKIKQKPAISPIKAALKAGLVPR